MFFGDLHLFTQLALGSHDLSQAEKQVTVVKPEQNANYLLSRSKFVILSENSCFFKICSALATVIHWEFCPKFLSN